MPSGTFGSDDTRPGYSDGNKRYSFLQSRRVFRYQPGRISGFTFGLKSSTEPVSGVTLEWGIKNPTDQYIFQIAAGQLKIIRRSTIPLPPSALKRSGLSALDQEFKSSGDPFDDEEYWTIEITRDKFNGDPLNGNGPSDISFNLTRLPCIRLNLVGMVQLVLGSMHIFQQVLERQDGL